MQEEFDFSTQTENVDVGITQDNTATEPKNPTDSGELFNYSDYTLVKEDSNKKKIKKVALLVSIPLISIFALSRVWSYLMSLIISVLSGVGIKTGFVSTAEFSETIQIAFSLFLFTIPFIIPLKLSGKTVSAVVPLSKPKNCKYILPLFLMGLSFCEFANIAVSYAGSIFESFGVNYSVDFGSNGKTFFGVVLSILATAVVPALVEEFALRGIVLGSLLPYGEGFAVMTSAVLFGVMHGNFEQMPFAFLVGLVLGLVRVKTDTLWICVLIHFANNFISLCVDYIFSAVTSDVRNIAYTLFLAFCLLLGIVVVAKISKSQEEGNIFSLNNKFEETTEKEKYLWFFTSIPTILFLGLYIFRSLKYLTF